MYFIASLTKPLRICFAKSKHPNNIISSQHKLNTIKIYVNECIILFPLTVHFSYSYILCVYCIEVF